MNVVYASNDGYARHLAVSMVSLFQRNQAMDEITVYVLSIGIAKDNEDRLTALAKAYSRELYMVELGDIRSRFSHNMDTRGFDISAMGRLFVGQLLPETINRVLYLDCDTVVAQPLEKLWNMDLKGKLLGAVMEPTIYDTVKTEIGLGEQEPYFNSGVLLIDLKQWRKAKAQKRLLDFYERKNGRLFACDQDTINGALKGEFCPLPPRYNFFTNYRYFSYRELVKHAKTYGVVTEEMFLVAKRHPAIIHYMGDERPWIAGNRNHYRRAYEKYLAMTPWAGSPKEKGKELYMLAYHILDYVTVLCPKVRWKISEKYGMKMVDARSKKG